MKNIHLIKTNKPSRLGRFVDTGNLFIRTDNDIPRGENVEIYITSDEEIKEGDWCLSKLNEVVKFGKKFTTPLYKKIILTKNDQLIQDGVQAVDDDFLEWFLNNSSCEKVETYSLGEENKLTGESCHYKYEIIIPQEEPKQNTMDKDSIDKFLDSLSDEELKEKWNKYNKHSEQENSVTISEFIENTKQETVEEVAERIWSDPNKQLTSKNSFIQGAKFQAERMFSEEEVIRFLQKYRFDLSSGKTPNIGDTTKEWFSQFKK
jgi:hypothetical protein